MPFGTINDDEHVLRARWVSVSSGEGRARLEMVWGIAAPVTEAKAAELPADVQADAPADLSGDVLPRQRERIVA
jgi:hypothetical protein